MALQCGALAKKNLFMWVYTRLNVEMDYCDHACFDAIIRQSIFIVDLKSYAHSSYFVLFIVI